MGIDSFKGALLSTLVAVSIALAIQLLSTSPVHAALNSHAPIYINGDNQFDGAHGVNGGGNGTAGNPYIIENWIISAKNNIGIEVRNTTSYFIIRNCYVDNGSNNLHDGIYFENVRNGKIYGVRSENNFIGINIYSSSNTIIENSTTLSNQYGISFSDSSGNVVENCTVSNNSSQGILLSNSPGNTIANSTIENDSVGVWSTNNSENNLIENNIVENNNLFGIFLDVSNNNNHIYHNNLINNENQAYDNSTNFWDNGYPSGGNYWSDYTGSDANGDGIGDTPYNFTGGQDRYPLMCAFRLVTLYKVNLNANLYLGMGSRLVVKFYIYMGDNQGENVAWENVTPAHVVLFENVPHPLSEPVEIVRLVLTTSPDEISTLASFTATKSVLASRYLGIKLEYVKPGADKPALATEYLKIKTQYVKAPS